MVPKPQGSAAQSVTHRPLPPLPKLRVRRPNKPETNPCLGVMSSVLGRYNWKCSGRVVVGMHTLGVECATTMGHHLDRQGRYKRNCTNLRLTGCWASSGYSVQGCAQLEQKLRQCMDAPVSQAWCIGIHHSADLSSANRIKRRIPSTTTSRECTQRSSDLTSETSQAPLPDRLLYIICIPPHTMVQTKVWNRAHWEE